MTASSPQPDDDAGERTAVTPPLPSVSAAEAAAGASAASVDAVPAGEPSAALPAPAKKRAPRAPRAPRAKKPTTPTAPPPPPLPASVAAARFETTASQASDDPGPGARPEDSVAEETVAEETVAEGTVAEDLIAVEEPVVVEEPVAVDAPVAVAEPVVEEEPVAAEESPAVVEEPVVVEEPAVVDEKTPVVEEEPVVEEPVVEDPIVVGEPVVAEEPVLDVEPVFEEESPVIVEEPVFEEESPVIVEEPAVEEPVLVEEPVAEEPVLDEEPVVAEESIVQHAAVVVEEPVAVDAGSDREEASAPADDDGSPDEGEDPLAAIASDEEPAVVVDGAVPALRLRGLTKSFGATRAVDGVDLTVPAGTFYGIVGPNGAGKTTTLSLIAGLLRPDGGSIEVAGVDLTTDPRRAKQQMGILPDRLRTFDRLTGRQLLHYYGVLRGLPSGVVETRTADLARAFDLADALGRQVSDFSTGMTKKLMLAGAMIHSPRVLVLDEPFESVDPVSSAVILDILAAYVEHGGTVILSSHGMDLVERVCSGVAIIVAGQVLAQGTIDEVRGELSLEQRFIELSGGIADVEGLEWLHTFSD